MKKEKIILSLIAAGVGLLVAGVIFYFYQSTKTIPPTKIRKISILVPTPTPTPSVFLVLNAPANESVTDKRIVTVSGKTAPDASILIVAPVDEVSAVASSQGDFSTTINLDDGQNILTITSIAPNGETAKLERVVTFSTEDF